MNRLVRTASAVGLCAALLGSRASADLITFTFSGTVDTAFATITLPGGAILPGDAISGLLTFDSLAPDQAPADPSTGIYSLSDIQVTIGSNTFTLSGGPPSPTLTVQNDVFGADTMTAAGPVTDGLRDFDLTVTYTDPTASALSSDALPLSFPAFPAGTLTLEFFGVEGELFVEGTLVPPPVIPAPSAAWLAVAGLVALGSGRRWIR